MKRYKKASPVWLGKRSYGGNRLHSASTTMRTLTTSPDSNLMPVTRSKSSGQKEAMNEEPDGSDRKPSLSFQSFFRIPIS